MKLLLACVLALSLQACGGADPADDGSADDLSSAKTHKCTSNSQCTNGQVCVSGKCQNPPPPPPGGCTSMNDCQNGGLCESGKCVASACDHRASNKTGLRATVQITRYQGLIHGANGDHEIAYGTLVTEPWVYVPSVIDTHNVQLALNVASSKDPAGLPHEIPFTAGQTVALEGEYISGASAGLGGTAVIHFTHSTCGYVTVNGTTYQ